MALPADLAPQWRRAFDSIGAELGGRVVAAERQPRWRPAWFLDLERDGETLPLYFRGERGETDHGVYALEHEMRVLEVLEAHGIPVPHVYHMCEEPRGIVMERSPGRANLASAGSEAERRAVLDDYVAILARIHAIDPAAFEAAGLVRPSTQEQIALMDLGAFEKTYRRNKRRPEPAVEFLLRWVRGHVPQDRSRVSLVCADAGQFLFEDGCVTAVLDLELACLGDPVADFGGMRGRDLSEPLGDLGRAVEVYEQHSGEPVDRAALDFHTVRFALVTPLSVSHLVAAPVPGLDLVQYLSWYLVYTRAALEVIGRQLGLRLNSPEDPSTEEGAAGDGFAGYEADREVRQRQYMERLERMGPSLLEEDLEDAGQLLGRAVSTREEADRELETRVASAGPADEPALVAFFHRRMLREERVVGPLLRELRGARIQML